MFAADLAAIDKLRTDAVNVQEAHVSGVHKIASYTAQLQWISGKFPIDVCVPGTLVYEEGLESADRWRKVGADFAWYPALGYNTQRPGQSLFMESE